MMKHLSSVTWNVLVIVNRLCYLPQNKLKQYVVGLVVSGLFLLYEWVVYVVLLMYWLCNIEIIIIYYYKNKIVA